MSATIIQRLKERRFNRVDFLSIRNNALRQLETPTSENARITAEKVLSACDAYAPEPLAPHYNFMGFCPGADIKRRLDGIWKEKKICEFHFSESEAQFITFTTQIQGDWIILKKRRSLKEQTMELFGFGQITNRRVDAEGYTYFEMDWKDQSEVLLVPLMGCNSTVNLRSLQEVEKNMPQEFWAWLKEDD